MSKNLTIQKAGVAQTFERATKINTPSDSGSIDWVAESDVSLGVLHVTKNGDYDALTDGALGYTAVIVDVESKTVTGKDKETGNTVSYSTDEEGNTIETVLPDEIRITTAPAKIEYENGETIDYTGLVVKAYLADGSVWTDATHPDGIIPIPELTLPVTEAEFESALNDDGVLFTNGEGLNAVFMVFDTPRQGFYSSNYVVGSTDGMGGWEQGKNLYLGCKMSGTGYITEYDGYVSPSYPAGMKKFFIFTYDISSARMGEVSDSKTSYQYGYLQEAKIGRWTLFAPGGEFENIPISTVNPLSYEDDSTLIKAGNAIPVQWTRPNDGLLLETSFNIDAKA